MKKILSFAAALTFAVAVISCGQKTETSETAADTTTVAPAAVDTTSVPATVDTAAAAVDTTAAH